MKNLDTIELFIDESADNDGIEALSLVKFPATEENWVALNNHRIEFKSIDDEKRIIIGLALVPDKLIYRRNGGYEYNIKFSKETVKKAGQLYLKRLNNNNATLEHKTEVSGVSVVESWIVENPLIDKTSLYNLNAVEGAWAVIMSIENDEVWQEIKNGTYLGISVEGYFSDEEKLKSHKLSEEEELLEKIKAIIKKSEFAGVKVSFDYDDTLSTDKGKGLARDEIAKGNDVWIITRRQESAHANVYEVADELGIPLDKVIFTNGKMKWEKIKELGIQKHYDNNEDELKLIRENTNAIAIKFKSNE